MFDLTKWLGLQIFAEGGDGSGDGATATGDNASNPAAGDDSLRALGVPESVLAKRANRARRYGAVRANETPAQTTPDNPQQNAPAEQTPETEEPDKTTPAKPTWDEIMQDPEYNQRMQETVQARLRTAKDAEARLTKLAPAFELLARKYGMDANNLDPDALTKAISDDDSYYEEKALELGVPVETAKLIDQNEREAERRRVEEARTIEQQRIQQHIEGLQRQGEALKQVFPQFDLATELQNPAFVRMTSPNVGISVEDAYYAVHRKEIQTAAMQVTAQKTAQQMANAIRSGQNRPVENGTSNQAPSVTTFDYAHASREQREELKRQIRLAAAQGRKIYPGQR